MVLVDATVLRDLVTAPNAWSDWSAGQLRRATAAGSPFANDVVVAEVSIGFLRAGRWEAPSPGLGRVGTLPHPALFRAGKAFREYRRRGGIKTGVLADFLIGAHAAGAGLRLLTRDAGRRTSYFPDVALIAPF